MQSLAGSQKRMLKELAECTGSGDENQLPPYMKVRLPDEADVAKWEVKIDAPSNTVYAGGHFTLLITLPKDYPFKPPVLNFATKIYHPNVSNDGKGSMCLGILRPDNWKPPNKIVSVLQMVGLLLQKPDPDDAVEPSIADQMKNRPAEFEKVAKDWVKRFAT